MAPDSVRAAGVSCLYADNDLLVLDKPAGLLCVPGRGADKQDCLSARAQALWPDSLVVHRLDQATSGLVLMARHPGTQRALGEAFAAGRVHKTYHAVVHGLPRPPGEDGGWGVIDAPLMRDWPRRPLQKVDWAQGKPSRTRWRVLQADAARDCALLELEPLTGRTHQLRLHLAYIGHPILGDALYADEAARQRAPRLLLHASALAFEYPARGDAQRFDSPHPFAPFLTTITP
ncbi:RluA family pseudouridine synthase [Melaminivora sp.]|uniref:RluA family pseudouridine synthase n=1 Tax=Melaminivora sp. TaxID=1933032 RepID=UPI0028AE814D|nr:RluA family pseudouridine synthase [Melaminivora sp.]